MTSGSKDENKPLDPLFPKMHINDFYEGGPKAPPRNKMALCETYDNNNRAPQGQRSNSGSMAMLKFPSRTGHGALEQPSSSSVDNVHQRMFPTVCCVSEPSHLTERYRPFHSTGVKFSAVPTKFVTQTSETTQCASGNSMSTMTCGSLQPNDFKLFDVEYSGSQNLEGMIEKNLTASSSASFEKRLCVSQKQANEIIHYKLRDHQRNQIEKKHNINPRNSDLRLPLGDINSALTPFNPLARNYVTALDTKPLQIFNRHEKCSLLDQPSASYRKIQLERETRKDDTSSIPETNLRRKRASSIDGNSNSLQARGDTSGVFQIDTNAEEKHGREQLANADKRKEIADSWEGSIAGLDETTNEFIRVLGGTNCFLKARKTILNHQRIFSNQVFELHRLIKVQQLLSRSPELRYRSRSILDERSIKFPPMGNLPFATPLHPSALLPKPKVDVQMPNHCKSYDKKGSWGNIPTFMTHAERGNPTQHSTPMTLATPVSFPNAKLAPWCFPPPGNHWLVPVKSPSEGLIYKPYSGPCPPNIGIMAPVSGNRGPISISPIGLTSDCTSSLNPKPERGQISGTGLGQGYFQPRAMMIPRAMSSNLEIAKMKQCAVSDNRWPNFSMDFSAPCQSSSGMQSQKSIISHGDVKENSKNRMPHGSRQLVALPLFPTTPSVEVSMEQCNEEKPQVIADVPHNPRPVVESATPLLQFIEERTEKFE